LEEVTMGAPPPAAAANAGPPEQLTYFIDVRAELVGGSPVADVDDIVIRTNEEKDPKPTNKLDPALLAAVNGRDVMIGAHGFHVTRDFGIQYLHHWHQWLDLGPNGYFVGVLWPGDSKWLHGLDYPGEYGDAIKSGQLVANYVAEYFGGANSVSFVSHSLGARVVLEAVNSLPDDFQRLNSLTVMAAAIDDTCLVAEYQKAAARMKRVSVLASKCDDVLRFLFPEGNIAAGIIHRGDPYWHGALGRYGPNPPNQPSNLYGSPILPDSWKFGHHHYINCYNADYFPPIAPPVSFVPTPLVVPAEGAADPQGSNAWPDWRSAWAAGFCSGRFG
jgi:hypothetical protein